MAWIDKLRSSTKHFGRETEDMFKKGLLGVSVTPRGIAMAYCDPKDTTNIIKACAFVHAEDFAHKQTALVKFVAEHNLEGVACSYVLAPIPQEYIITMIEAPHVPSEELAQAMKWLIREMIPFPVEEAIIDAFELPYPRARDNAKIAYAVVLRRGLIREIEKLTKHIGLSLNVIDIPEMALRNIVNFYLKKNDKGCLVLKLYPTGGKFVWCRDGMLCVTRTIELNLEELVVQNAEPDQAALEGIALEIQRSLDYISSIFRQEAPNSIVLMPSVLNLSAIETYLKNNLSSEVMILDLKNVLKPKEDTKINQANVLLAIGGALRVEDKG